MRQRGEADAETLRQGEGQKEALQDELLKVMQQKQAMEAALRNKAVLQASEVDVPVRQREQANEILLSSDEEEGA